MAKTAKAKKVLLTHQREANWHKHAIIYQIHIKSFFDSNADGIGDFKGLTSRLDYLQNLGITALWLLPFYPSPLKDDGYDISDYTNIHPAYGTLRDFKEFLREAHFRNLKIITELVINHTSDQHPWFQRSRLSKPGSTYRNFYVWSDTPDKYKESRIIFQDYETSNWSWDPLAKAYYWHRFFSHQPDLNFENPAVHQAVKNALDFWMDLGVDGMRLDAVPYLYEKENTICENLPETHQFLKSLRKHIDESYDNRIFLAEANQWPEDAVAYFGQGDECHMNFHFPLMPRMFMAFSMEDRFPIIDILSQTPAIPDNCQWATFLRNHDELTLEMVTDEERDYMYQMYASEQEARINLGIRRRLAPLLGNDRRKIELMNGLLFSLPGTPIIYYGDEIGMGDNIYLGDRNGVRTPMQWAADRNAGFSKANPQKLYFPVIIDPEYHYEFINVEVQEKNSSSLISWMKKLIASRKRFQAFQVGDIEFLQPENRKVIAFLRKYHHETILVIANLSRLAQYVELDLKEYNGYTPIEISGQINFPKIGELPYFITLSPYSFYWFSLEKEKILSHEKQSPGRQIPTLILPRFNWPHDFTKLLANKVESILPQYLQASLWFRSKSQKIKSTSFINTFQLPKKNSQFILSFLEVTYIDYPTEIYLLPLTLITPDNTNCFKEKNSSFILLEIFNKERNSTAYLVDTIFREDFMKEILLLLASHRKIKGNLGEIKSFPTTSLKKRSKEYLKNLPVQIASNEQSNSSILFDEKYILKLFRKIEVGINPDLELSLFLKHDAKFENTPKVESYFEYLTDKSKSTLGILFEFIPNEGNAWDMTLIKLDSFYDRVLTKDINEANQWLSKKSLISQCKDEITDDLKRLVGPYHTHIQLLGQRTAEMHIKLASNKNKASLRPQLINIFYQRSLYQSIRTLTDEVMRNLKNHQKQQPLPIQDKISQLLQSEKAIHNILNNILNIKMDGYRIRCHGDYHLGQIIYTGKDFHIIDFEGEPARPLSQRLIKRSAFKDIAGMLRSFHYATMVALQKKKYTKEEMLKLLQWGKLWTQIVSTTFLKSYFSYSENDNFLPTTSENRDILLNAILLEKALYECLYELNNRPEWLEVPITGILDILEKQRK